MCAMMNTRLLNKLHTFGLNNLEAEIYAYLYQNDLTGALKISRDLNIERTKVYRILERLKERNLVVEILVTKGKRFKAKSLQELDKKLDEEKQLISEKIKILDELKEEMNSLKISYLDFEIRHFTGLSGLKQMLWNHLSTKDKIITGFGYQTRNKIVGKKFAEKIRKEQIFRKIIFYELENFEDQTNLSYTDIVNWFDFYKPKYISPSILEIKQYLVIYDDVVSIINWNGSTKLGIEIKNKDYAEMHKQMFWHFWNLDKTT